MNIALAIWYLVFGEPSVGKAVKNINKAVGKLEKAVTHQTDKAARQKALADAAMAAMVAADAEAERAKRVAGKMGDLLA